MFLQAFDPDGNAISYSISSSGFSIDSSGNIRSNSALSTASQTKTFVVAATDTTGLSTTATVTVRQPMLISKRCRFSHHRQHVPNSNKISDFKFEACPTFTTLPAKLKRKSI